MIPRHLHFFWDGPKPPDISQWEPFLDLWKVRRWTAADLTHKDTKALVELGAWATLADVARVEAMISGGIYLDTDFLIVQSLDKLRDLPAFVCLQSSDMICNAALGSTFNHPFFRAVSMELDKMDLVRVAKSGYAPEAGPDLMTKVCRNLFPEWHAEAVDDGQLLGKGKGAIKLLKRDIFYPYLWDTPPCPPKLETIAVHLWEGSWKATTRQQNFDRVYSLNSWGQEHPSGPGSTHEFTVQDANILKKIIKALDIRTLSDAPCGVFSWMRTHGVTDLLESYDGYDIVPAITKVNQEWNDIKHSFFTMDLVAEKQRVSKIDSDLILCRECTQHLTEESTLTLLQNVLSSKAKYLLITNYVDVKQNLLYPTWGEQLDGEGYRPQNLDLYPYSLSTRLEKLGDFLTSEWNGINRYLSLYALP